MKAWGCALALSVGMVAMVSGCSSLTEVESATATVAISQTKCPVMGRAIDEKVFVEHGDRRVYFCCVACESTFKKAPALFLAKLDAEPARTAAD